MHHPAPPGRRAARRLGLGAALAGLLTAAATPALAIPRCASDTEQAVFEVEALKTELMVVATTCKGNTEDQYNAFVRRYQPALAATNRALGAYFARHGGQRAFDSFITELANARSNAARQLGGDFCPRNAGQFDEVMSLSGATDLPAYAAGKDLLSAGVHACPSGSGGGAARPARSTRR